MKRTELEELLSAYIDDELSPEKKKKVEALVKTNAQAKSILDDYMSVRKAFQRESGSLRHKAPADLTTKVLAAIDAQTPQPKTFESVRYKTVSRWSNPRIFAYPLAILICALFIGIFYRPDGQTGGERQTADGGRQNTEPGHTEPGHIVPGDTTNGVEQTAVGIVQPGESIIPPPLSADGGTIPQSEIPVKPANIDLRFTCRVENTTSVSTIFAKVFAKYEVASTKSTSGPANTVVYEISVTSETLLKILADLRTNSVEISGNTEDLSTEKPVKVFFQVEN